MTTRRRDEEELLQQVREIARFSGWDLQYHTRDSRRSDAGFPDLILIRAPRIIFAELKSDKGRLTPKQVEWLEALRRCGQETHVWRPSDRHVIAQVLSRRQDDAAIAAAYRLMGDGGDTVLERIQ